MLRRAAYIAVLILLPAGLAQAQELMPGSASGWAQFSARPDTTPGLLASASSSGYALEIFGNGVPNVYGGWRTRILGVHGGNHYRFRARALPVDVSSPRESITILLRWRGAFGDNVAPDYVWNYRAQSDGTLLFDRVLQAPAGTTAVEVELVLQWAGNGRVRFDALSLVAAAAPASRPVKAAAVSYRPSGTSSGLESVQRAANYGEQVAAAHRPDVMVFGEMLNVIGAPGTYDAKAEPVPGPSTDRMSALARAYGVNVVFGLLERHDRFLYNTAVLIGRDGNIVGKHRKMQLPLQEVSAGLSPGDGVAVFQADFGRVALLICQDTAFPEPAREAAVQGAEMLLVPIWGGKASLVQARAIEQSMYVVASGYDYFSEVVDPLGSVLDRVETLGQADAAVATIDLAQRFREDWVGDWRDTSNKQRRIGIYKADQTTVPGGDPPPPPPPNVPPAVAITAPPNGASFTAPATITISASASDSDGTITRVDFYAGATLIGSDTAGPYAFAWSGVPAGSYTLTARAFDNAGGDATSSAVTVSVVTPPPPPAPSLPAPWQTQDIGAVGTPGTAAASNGTFTVEGAGADIWGTADAFRYVWQPVNGDVDVIARVGSLERVHDWVKAGVMIRERLTADSAHALMLVSAGKGLAYQRRTAAGGLSTHTSGGPGTAPAWVKLERRGNSIAAYHSLDGSAWTLVATETFAMGASVYAGLAVSSHSTSELATVTFDTVTVRSVAPTEPAWQSQDVGAVGVAGSATTAGGTFTVRGAGADVWGTADAFHYVWRRLSGDGDAIARVTSVEYVHAWVKAGVMIRERLTPDSPHAFMLASAGKGIAFQRRVASAGLSTHTSGGLGTAPVWLKLERRGNVISAYWSGDGVAWNFVASDSFGMTADVYVGLAVSSHDSTRLATATFENVSVK